MVPAVMNVIRTLIGRPRDWGLDRLRLPRLPRPSLAWVGPLAVVVSTLVGWFAFTGAQGEEGSVTFGLFIGSASIVSTCSSFIGGTFGIPHGWTPSTS